MKQRAIKNIFLEGAIAPEVIAQSIAHHQTKTNIGAHDLFLGQVRADEVKGKCVAAIEYSAQASMANAACHEIRERAFEKYALHCLHIHHSLGMVSAGQICFYVFASAQHRTAVFEAIPFIVDEFKANVPIFGKEIFGDDSHQWKVNQ